MLMKMSMILLLFLSMLSLLSLITCYETGEFLGFFCPNNTTFTSPYTDRFQFNLNIVLNTLTSPAAPDTSFYSTTAGLNSTEKAYGLFLCQGFVSTQVCKDCVTAASRMAAQRCPNRINVIVWYDYCMLRYSNKSLSILSESPIVSLYNMENATEWNRFKQVLGKSMNEVVTEATNNTANKFATKQANISRFLSVYSLAQCTWDLSAVDCNRCLKLAVARLPSCCESVGGRVLMPSCNVRYEIFPFYDQNATSARAPAQKALPPPAPFISVKHLLQA